MAKRENFSTGSKFEEAYGYSRAVKVGDHVFVSGTVGLNYETGVFAEDPAEQFRQAIKNIEKALAMAGTSLKDVVTIALYISDAAVMDSIGAELKNTFGEIRPTNTALVTGFPFPEIKVEIQVNAIIGCGE